MQKNQWKVCFTHTHKIIAGDLITLFSGRKEQDNGTRLGERKKERQTKERSTKWTMKTKK